MSDNQILFNNGAAYERYMGRWSQLAGQAFLDWLAPPPNARWLDVGCGNGAFTHLIGERCQPGAITGIDPSEEQLAFARTQADLGQARFVQGDAMALPFDGDAFDAAVMPLVIFFVPDPARGVAEMVRVVRSGGSVSAYAWDMENGGFPYDLLHQEMRAMGIAVPTPPSPEASRLDALHALWQQAGLTRIDTCAINVQRTYAHFADYWTTVLGGPSVGAKLAAMSEQELAHLKARLQQGLPTDANGQITCQARANAIKGHVHKVNAPQ